SSLDLTKRRDRAVEAEVLASMAEHGWWTSYGVPTPSPLPQSFDAVPEHVGAAWNSPPLYYIVMSRYLRLIGARSVIGQYYAVRAAAVCASLLTFGFLLAAAREWFDDRTALVAGAIVAVVPQFA